MPKALPTMVDDAIRGWMIFCPACQCGHEFLIGRWKYNNDGEKPTFTPSMLIKTNTPDLKGYRPEAPSSVCHSHVTDGKIQYLGDCTHAMANTTVDLPDWDTFKRADNGRRCV